MLLPSGRSNSDVHPLQNTQKPQYLTRTSSPQLSIAAQSPTVATTTTIQSSSSTPSVIKTDIAAGIATKAENGYTLQMGAKTTPSTAAAAPAPATTKTLSTSVSPGSQSESGTDRISTYPTFLAYKNATPAITTATISLSAPTTTTTATAVSLLANAGNWEEIDRYLQALQCRLKEGWTVHVGKDGRLYYCK